MPLHAEDPGYGSVAASPGGSGGVGGSESVPLLIPEPEPVQWQPMTKEELEAAAGGPGWKKLRARLVLLFWLAWLAMLGTSIAIIVKSPRPVVTPLQWWQKSLFYQLQPALFTDVQGQGGISVLCERLPYLKSLGIGALILEDLFHKEASPSDLTMIDEGLGTVPQILYLLTESNKVGLKVVLDLCELDLFGSQNPAGKSTDVPSELSATVQYALRFWLEQGVAGFAICDTDAAYSEETLLEWRGLIKEFSTEEEERIVVVKQTGDVLPALNTSSSINVTLVEVVMKSILPPTRHPLSSQEVAVAIETHLQTAIGDIWTSWTGQEKVKRSALALFTSLSHSRAKEEALLFGSFTFLPYNTTSLSSSNSTLASPSSSPPILAFLRSWGCVHFLVLLNIGPESHALDPAWAPSLPDAGVFVTSTGLDRLGSTNLGMLELKPQEAIVIKLFEAGSYT
ncbi:amino acid transporter heavy chain SLC3A2 [Diretmus argenteus]